MNWEFIARYDSMAAATKATGADRGRIRDCDEGIHTHAAGFKWKVIESNTESITDEELAQMRRVPEEYGKWYYVGKDGRVASTYGRRARWKFMKIKTDDNGYQIVQFSNKGKTRNYRVHVLVAKTWLPTPLADQTEVNHKNKVRTDNRLDNLEWVSRSQNMRHAYETQAPRKLPSPGGNTDGGASES